MNLVRVLGPGTVGEYDPILMLDSSVTIETDRKRSVMLFSLIGDVDAGGTIIKEKTAAKLTEGDRIELKSLNQKVQILFMSSQSLNEPVAWGGPVVMNSSKELQKAYNELSDGTFLQSEMNYSDQ